MKAKRITQEAGDCTALYEIILEKEYTVKSLLEEILTKREWGCFSVKDGSSCDYKWGNLLTQLNDGDLMKLVKKVTAFGGYSYFNYNVETYKGGEQ